MSNLNKNIKIFFIDLDGTLLDSRDANGELTISQKNIDVIKELSSSKEIVISTGRSGPFVKKCLDLINGRFAVMSNGAYVVDYKNHVLRDVKISIKQNLLIWDIVKNHKLISCVEANNFVYGVRSRIFNFFVKKMGRISQAGYNLDTHLQYHKFLIWGKTKGQIKKVAKELEKKVKELSIVKVNKGLALEVTHKKATKLLGNLAVAKLLKVKENETMHIGDSMNDASTAEKMRLVAMKNASKELKKLTSYHGPHYKRSGVAKILQGQYTKN